MKKLKKQHVFMLFYLNLLDYMQMQRAEGKRAGRSLCHTCSGGAAKNGTRLSRNPIG